MRLQTRDWTPRLLTLVLLLLAPARLSASADSAKADKWLDVFTPLSGARQLCSQSVLGLDGADHVEIYYTLYTSTRQPAEVAKLLAEAHGVDWQAGQTSITVKRDGDSKILTVSPLAANHLDCGVKPDRDVRSIIAVSQMMRVKAGPNQNDPPRR